MGYHTPSQAQRFMEFFRVTPGFKMSLPLRGSEYTNCKAERHRPRVREDIVAHQQPVRSGSKAERSRSARSSAVAKPAVGREIPDKLYFRIGEVAKLCEVAPYVLRFWESEFTQLKPNKGGTGQRLYRRRDVEMALRVKMLLHDEGYTIAGARQYLKGELRSRDSPSIIKEVSSDTTHSEKLQRLRAEMQSLLATLSQPAAASKPKGAAVQSIRAAKPRAVAVIPEVAGLFDSVE